ncbi:MAG: hypothetical protein ACOY94_22095 [Bacillota bacterium]
MNRPLGSAVAALLLLAGCSAPSETPQQPEVRPGPAPMERPTPPAPQTTPSGAPQVVSAHGGVLLKGVQDHYLWYAGGQRLAIFSDTGLWSVRPDGGELELLIPAGPARTLVGSFEEGVVYLEQQKGALVAGFVRPGQSPQQLAVIEHEGVEAPGYPFWGAVSGSQLTVAVEERRPVAVDMRNGRLTELGDEAIPVWRGELALSPSRRYLAYKQANRGDGVRVLDLESGAVFRPGEDAHLGQIAWSPAGGQWAVRAAAPGSHLPAAVGANLEEGGTHLDLGDTRGGLRRLTPPAPLELVDGPWWSKDGKWVAVVAGKVETTPGQTTAPQHLWVVDPATGDWRRLGRLPAGSFVTGFHPALLSLMVHSEQGLHLWPLSGSEPVQVTPPWIPGTGSPLLLPGGDLLYASAERAPLLLRQEPSGQPATLLDPGVPLGQITVQGRYAALALYSGDRLHDLLLLPLAQ